MVDYGLKHQETKKNFKNILKLSSFKEEILSIGLEGVEPSVAPTPRVYVAVTLQPGDADFSLGKWCRF